MAFGTAIIALLTTVGSSPADGLQDASPRPPLTQPQTEPAAHPSEPVITPEDALIQGRRRPGVPQHELPHAVSQTNEGAVRAPPPEAFPNDEFPVPDRWRLIQSLGLVKERWFDPYGQNTLKGDRPICTRSEEEDERRSAKAGRNARRPNSCTSRGRTGSSR